MTLLSGPSNTHAPHFFVQALVISETFFGRKLWIYHTADLFYDRDFCCGSKALYNSLISPFILKRRRIFPDFLEDQILDASYRFFPVSLDG